ncbi:DNA-3-methyladenine glycosylase family protein [Methanospirillum lacunae]|nr:DNA glycosylase [Methanospirillum lacunae]
MKTYHLTPEQLPFDLDLTLDCGQVFRWNRAGGQWAGVIAGKVITISQNGDLITYDGINEAEIIRYFNLEIKAQEIISQIKYSISKYACETGIRIDELFESVASAGAGLRIIRQDPWECLISFICSQNSNIPTITKRISLLCERYGKPIGNTIFGFPSPADLARRGEEELRTCCTGYRAPYLAGTAQYVLRDPDFLSRLFNYSTQDAKDELMKLPGVGPKVADCILLFAYNRYEVVPVDVWIRNIITTLYPEVSSRRCNRKECSYNDIADFCREYFGEYAGYAQQYFFASRQNLPVKQGERV